MIEWNAKDYAKNSAAQEIWANELIAKLNLQGNEAILDIGCGDGKITASIAQQITAGRVAGIDRSESMISHATQSFKLPNLSFQVMDAEVLSFAEEFDIAFSSAVLHWVHDHKAVLRGLGNCLSHDGKILFQMGGRGNVKAIQSVVDELIATAPRKPFFRDFTKPYRFCSVEEYEQWLAETGYRAERIELIPKDMVHRNRETLQGWLRTTWFPYTARLPEESRDAFLDQVVDTYLHKHPTDSNGQTHVQMIRLEIEASRKQ